MERTAVNPWAWPAAMGYHQGEIVSGHTRTLFRAGQTAMSADGKPSMPVTWRSGAAGVAPTTTTLGVTRLAMPVLMVELEGTAVA